MLDWLKNLFTGPGDYQPSAPSQKSTVTVVDCGTEDYTVAIVGESNYMPALRRAKLVADEDDSIRVMLMREPENQFDKGAIVVRAIIGEDAAPIGYLSRETAADYRRAVEHWEAQGVFVTCRGQLLGGEPGRENIGVWLDLMEPEEIRHLEID